MISGQKNFVKILSTFFIKVVDIGSLVGYIIKARAEKRSAENLFGGRDCSLRNKQKHTSRNLSLDSEISKKDIWITKKKSKEL